MRLGKLGRRDFKAKKTPQQEMGELMRRWAERQLRSKDKESLALNDSAEIIDPIPVEPA